MKEIKKVHKILRDLTDTGKTSRHSNPVVSAADRHTHFRNIFAAARPPIDANSKEVMKGLADPRKAAHCRRQVPSDAPSLEEIEQAISKLKTGRVAGVKGLKAKILRFGKEAIAPQLHRICQSIWDHVVFPTDWVQTAIIPVLKKGKPATDVNSHRPISLVSVACKVLIIILHIRLSPMVEDTVGDHQHGFRPKRSTTDVNFTYRLLCAKFKDRQEANPRMLHRSYPGV